MPSNKSILKATTEARIAIEADAAVIPNGYLAD
jgi:hypothetical protein